MRPTRLLPDLSAHASLAAAVRAHGVACVVRAVLAADPGTPGVTAPDPLDTESDPDRCPCRPLAGAA